MITKPGIYYDFSAVDYFADPAPSPSLTQSLCKTLIDRSPLHAWHNHPRLNPHFEHDDPTKYDIGNIAHRLLIGRGKVLKVLDADDWRTKDAQKARADAAANGYLAVLAKHYKVGVEMAAAAQKQLKERKITAFTDGDGKGEVVGVCKEGDVWLRTMIDWLETDNLIGTDFKTTSASASPYAVATRMIDGGWELQAAMQERILDTLDPETSGRRTSRFVLQENVEPYALTVVELPESVMTLGRKRLGVAIEIWRRSVETNTWPAYPLAITYPEFPSYQETRWLEREHAYAEAGLWPKDLQAPLT